MAVSEEVERLVREIRLLDKEERNQLIAQLVSEKRKEDRSPDEREVLADGTIRETYWVRPEERRRIHHEKYDLFMGLIKFSYFPPSEIDYIRAVLEEWSYIPRHFFQSPAPKVLRHTVQGRPLSDENAKQLIEGLAAKKGVSSATFLGHVDKLINEISQNLFWDLAKRYEAQVRQAENDLMTEIQLHLCQKIGIELSVAEKQGEINVVKALKGDVLQKQIEHPRHRPKNSKQSSEEFEESLRLILYDLVAQDKQPIDKITLSVLRRRLQPVIGAIEEPALRARLRKCGIRNWKEYRERVVSQWKNKS